MAGIVINCIKSSWRLSIYMASSLFLSSGNSPYDPCHPVYSLESYLMLSLSLWKWCGHNIFIIAIYYSYNFMQQIYKFSVDFNRNFHGHNVKYICDSNLTLVNLALNIIQFYLNPKEGRSDNYHCWDYCCCIAALPLSSAM